MLIWYFDMIFHIYDINFIHQFRNHAKHIYSTNSIIFPSNLGIRHPIHLGNNPVPGIQLSNSEVAR